MVRLTGSRIQYLGRKYYVELVIDNTTPKITIDFTESKFKNHASQSTEYTERTAKL
jgi:hypothetical protein